MLEFTNYKHRLSSYILKLIKIFIYFDLNSQNKFQTNLDYVNQFAQQLFIATHYANKDVETRSFVRDTERYIKSF